MATVYFGGCDSLGNPLGTSTDILALFRIEIDTSSSLIYNTCPGSGPQILQELSIYAFTTASDSSQLRCAIYGPVDGVNDTNLVCQGSAAIPYGTTVAWYGHTSFTDSLGNPIIPRLQGGSIYRLLASGSSGTGKFQYGSGGAHNKYQSGDSTPGWPATLAVSGSDMGTELPDIRAGVQSASVSPAYASGEPDFVWADGDYY